MIITNRARSIPGPFFFRVNLRNGLCVLYKDRDAGRLHRRMPAPIFLRRLMSQMDILASELQKIKKITKNYLLFLRYPFIIMANPKIFTNWNKIIAKE